MAPEISVVIPVMDEEGNVAALAREIAVAFADRPFEMIFVDDASRDGTRAALIGLKSAYPSLRVIAHQRNAGQSRALRSGVEAALAPIVVTLDGDGQNDPADAPRLVERLRAGGAGLGLVGGLRLRRQDSWSKRLASRIGNGVRRRILRDDSVDTGCGLKVMPRAVFLRLPYFDHMHRFLPALTLISGRTARGELIARTAEVATKEQADAMRGLELHVPRSALPPPDEEEFYQADLVGLQARGPDGAILGKIKAVLNFGAGDLLEVTPEGGGPTWMVAFTRANAPELDFETGNIVIVRPEETE